MNEGIFYPITIIILGIIVAAIIFIVLKLISSKIINFLQLYPESKKILPIALNLISLLVSGIVFLLFLQFALYDLKLQFTWEIVKEIILVIPAYILAILLVIAGFYVSRMVREKSADYSFENKNKILIVIDFVIHMTFIFTALALIGINTIFFVILYEIALGVIGFIVALTVGLTIGIPLGFGIYNKLKKDKTTNSNRHRKK